MRPIQANKFLWKNYFNFKGRSKRSEFWWILFWYSPLIVLVTMYEWLLPILPVKSYIFEALKNGYLASLILFSCLFLILLMLICCWVLCIPFFSLQVRRLHDINLPGWWFIVVTIILHILHIIAISQRWSLSGLYFSKGLIDLWFLFILFLDTIPSKNSSH